jgi:hypothetical protein
MQKPHVQNQELSCVALVASQTKVLTNIIFCKVLTAAKKMHNTAISRKVVNMPIKIVGMKWRDIDRRIPFLAPLP